MDEVKQRVIRFLKLNKGSGEGFELHELSWFLDIPYKDIGKCMFTNDCFYCDKTCEPFTGWKLKDGSQS